MQCISIDNNAFLGGNHSSYLQASGLWGRQGVRNNILCPHPAALVVVLRQRPINCLQIPAAIAKTSSARKMSKN